MKSPMKKLFFLLLIIITPEFFLPAQVWAREPMVVVRDGGKTIYESGSNVVWPAASITKLMTTLVLMDMKKSWTRSVTLTKADEVGGARLRVAVGGRYKAIDLLHAGLMGSANNAMAALARTSGVTKKTFVKRMNAKAKKLGMAHTTFVDPTGMSPKNVSTAEDLAILIETARKNKIIRQIGQKETYTLRSIAKRPRVHTINNTNALLADDSGVVLGKTGYLNESLYNFAMVAAAADGTDRTVVVLGAPTKASSFQLAREFGKLGQ